MSAALRSGNTIGPSNESVKKAYFTFGRFQPPTLGHRLLATGIAAAAARDGADAYIFASSSQDKKKNPLNVATKVRWMKKIFSGVPIRIIDTTEHDVRTVPKVIGKLIDSGYPIENIKMFVGSDRTEDFGRFVPKEVQIVSVGEERNESRSNLAGMSGTKMRAAAYEGNINTVAAGTGLSKNNATELSNAIVSGLGLSKAKAGAGTARRTRRARNYTRRR
jgi:nicotinic acid mononucleotide adenylyltransferase